MKKVICIILIVFLSSNFCLLCSCQPEEATFSERDIELANNIYEFAEKERTIEGDYTEEYLINVSVHNCDGEMYLDFTYAEKPIYKNSESNERFASLGRYESFYYKVTPQSIDKERLQLGLGSFQNSDKSCFWEYNATEEEQLTKLYKIAQFIIGDGNEDT